MHPSTISKYEWRQARRHAKHPGPFMPVRKPQTRCARFKRETILKFLGHLEGFLQDHAYGNKNAVTSTGAIVQLDAVSTTAQPRYIMRDYIKSHHPDRLTRDEGGCHKKFPKFGIYCNTVSREKGMAGNISTRMIQCSLLIQSKISFLV